MKNDLSHRRNFCFKRVSHVYVMVHTSNPPTDAEWQELLDEIKLRDLSRVCGIAYSLGGGPTTVQRKQMSDVFAGKHVSSAILSNSMSARSIITAVSWFNRSIKSYRLSERHLAYDFLEIDADLQTAVSTALDQLKEELFSEPASGLPHSRRMQDNATS